MPARPPQPTHELGILAAFLAAMVAAVVVTLADGSAAAVELRLHELVLGLAFALGAVTVPRRPPGG